MSSEKHPALQIDLQVSPTSARNRLDHFLLQHVAGTSRSNLIQSIRLGLILVDGQKKKSSYRLKAGELITGTLFQAVVPKLVAQKIPFDILFEDDFLLIVSKPPGIVVHPGAGNADGTLVNGLLYHCRDLADVGDQIRPGIVHRLDKDTSGVMVVAKTVQSHRILVEAFKEREVHKEYLALVYGVIAKKRGRIVAPITRHPVNRQKMAVCDAGKGRHAASSWQVVEEYSESCSLVRVQIETGRTHQIRVHLSSLGHPVAGDILYGRARNTRKYSRQMLHAHRLHFSHPVSGKSLTFSAPLWPDFKETVNQLRLRKYEEYSVVL